MLKKRILIRSWCEVMRHMRNDKYVFVRQSVVQALAVSAYCIQYTQMGYDVGMGLCYSDLRQYSMETTKVSLQAILYFQNIHSIIFYLPNIYIASSL